MQEAATEGGALYIYGIARAEAVEGLRLEGVGDPPAPVDSVRHEGLAALVSRAPDPPERSPEATRQDLLAHARTLEAVVERTAVLPMRFGMTLSDTDAVVRDLLSPRYERWDALLERYRDRVELIVKAFHDEALLLRTVIDEHPQIQHLRGAKSVQDRMRLGELVAAAVEQRRQADAEWLLTRLREHAQAVHESPPELSGMVANAAFLVGRDQVRAFDQEVAALAEEAGERLRLRCVGPQPPYTFVAAEG